MESKPDKQDKKPTPTADTIFAPPKIKAKVREHNRYGAHHAGEIVEVTEREYARAKHALVTDADEKAEKQAAVEAAKPPDQTALFRAFRHRARAAQAQKQKAAEDRKRQEFAALGFRPAAG